MEFYRHHRFICPVETVNYKIVGETSSTTEQVTKSGVRDDGRENAAQFRQICISFLSLQKGNTSLCITPLFYFIFIVLRVGIVANASGSAFIEMGNTMLVCAVYFLFLFLFLSFSFSFSFSFLFFSFFLYSSCYY